MTLTDYINQTDPQPNLNVQVHRSECDVFWPCHNDGENIQITVGTIGIFTYHKFKTGQRLWTIDKNGNPDQRSVFSIID